MSNSPDQKPLEIEISEEVAEGIYANLAVITHSPSEFVLDFIKILPNMPKAKVKARMLLTPSHTKRFLQALQDNIVRYEQMHGVIRDAEEIEGMPITFGMPTGQA